MRIAISALALSTILGVVPALAQDKIKIGFVSTFSGPTAVIGNDMRNSVELALDHLGLVGGRDVALQQHPAPAELRADEREVAVGREPEQEFIPEGEQFVANGPRGAG